ncbi:MAG: 2-hydroxy-3-oxopropionate reductase [Betaproteobacteria bacterium RIFCSPLOWO2_12_FULL_62_13]|nr:MAG: 2-hydroxy-3-oxopropionate reductase [Betaproteobacteria bacterium RIFCSPLOWO2_12_FULL_62_13]
MKLGFIGLGVMGRPMALNLMKHGHEMGVYARRPESIAPLVSAGARGYRTPAELASDAEVIFTMVTTSNDVEQVVLGKDGLIHGAARGSVLVDMETISPTVARGVAQALAAKGIDMLDAPVSGGPMGAEQASLSIMVGGKQEVFERVKPLFECMGKTIVRMGDHGAGQITKACNQLALLVTAQGTAEALALAKSCGVDPARVREVLLGGIAASRVLELFGKRMVEHNFENGIDTRLYHKDLYIALDLAHESGLAAPAAALTMQHINALIGRGEGRSDLSALIKVVEEMSKAPITNHQSRVTEFP